MKTCPICKENKTKDNYYFCYDKKRDVKRIGSYCKKCTNIQSAKKNKNYYKNNKEKVKQKAKEYRENNVEKIKKSKQKFSKKYREELKECYVAYQASLTLKCSTKEIHENPTLLEAYTLNLKLKRKLNNYGKK